MTNAIFVITGPSGVGKDTVIQHLEEYHLPLRRVITTASRPMRSGESQGHPYYFVTAGEFERLIADEAMAEYAKVFDSWKGITRAELERSHAGSQGVLLKIDFQGARTIKKLYPEAQVIVITPPSLEELRTRLWERSHGREAELDTRLSENEHWSEDYAGFDHYVINPNQHPEQAAQEIANLIKKYLKLD